MKNGKMFDLKSEYDSAKSFGGKAKVLETNNKNVNDLQLYSYNTLVARITTICGIKTYYYFGKYSQTTTRHQKEFFRQNGLSEEEIAELFKNGKLEVKESE